MHNMHVCQSRDGLQNVVLWACGRKDFFAPCPAQLTSAGKLQMQMPPTLCHLQINLIQIQPPLNVVGNIIKLYCKRTVGCGTTAPEK